MNKRLTATLAILFALAGCGGYGGGSSNYMAPGSNNAPGASSTPAMTAMILGANGFVTPQGFTLYEFSADGTNTSNCTGACAAIWPPFMAASGAQASGNFTINTRADGSHQWAYKGHPLYTFSGDTQPGQANGENVSDSGGTFTVARP
jgi:predicted lipoprotein with Yx(FWY)xxD motif